jgi:HlyD family secretion protein
MHFGDRNASVASQQERAIDAGGTDLRTVAGLGKLIPQSDVITLALPYGAGDARIEEILVEEGDSIEKDQLLASLDNGASLEAALEQAKTGVAVMQAQLLQTRKSVEAGRAEAEAALARAEATARNAEQAFKRTESLVQRRTLPDSAYDEKLAERDAAARAVDEARAELSRYAGGPIDDEPDVLVARRNLDAAQADLARAHQDLKRASLVSPIGGTVLAIHADPGERPGNEGVMDIGDTERMMAKIEIYESEVTAIAIGDPVTIRARALPDGLTGQVSHIGLEVKRQTLIDDDPAANTDARVVEVKVTLDDSSSAAARRLTGLQVEARIRAAPSP